LISFICRLLRVELRPLHRNDHEIRHRNRVAHHQARRAFEIDDDERRFARRLFDHVDDRFLGHVADHRERFRLARQLRPIDDVLIRIGVDHGDAHAALGQLGRENRGGRRLAGTAFRRRERDHRHEATSNRVDIQ